jgi:hypothetical protein
VLPGHHGFGLRSIEDHRRGRDAADGRETTADGRETTADGRETTVLRKPVGLKYSERVSSETAQSVAVASEIPSTDQLYTASYYASNLGIPYERNEHWLRFFGTVGDRIVSSLAPSTALDVGCAFGFLVEALRDRGVDATGTDISEYAISQVGGSAVGHCRVESALEPYLLRRGRRTPESRRRAIGTGQHDCCH